MSDLSTPDQIMIRLEQIDRDLADRQNLLEAAALGWFRTRREVEFAVARALIASTAGSVTEKKAEAAVAVAGLDGLHHEAEYEALKAVVRVLETRATIGMALLKSHGRVA